MIRKKFSKKELFFGISLAVLATFILTFYIWHQAESYRLGITNQKLEKEIQAIKKTIDELETKKAEMLSLTRIEKIAQEDLHLEKIKKEQIIYPDYQVK